MAKKSKKGNKITVDMSDVEARFLPAEDDYRVKPVEVTKEEGNEHDYLRWKLEITKGEHKGKHIYENTSLAPAALFRLRGMLEASGQEVPDSEMDIDLDTICDEMGEFMVSVYHDEYEPGKTSAKVSDYFPVKGKDDKDDDDEDDKKKSSKKKSSKKKDEEEDDDDDDKKDGDDDDEEPDFSDMDEDELSEFVEEHDLDVDLDDFKKLKAKREAVKDAYEESKSEDDDDDKKGKGKKKGKKKYSAEDIDGMGTAQLAEINDDEELEVELKGTTKAKRRAIKKALKEAGKLEE